MGGVRRIDEVDVVDARGKLLVDAREDALRARALHVLHPDAGANRVPIGP